MSPLVAIAIEEDWIVCLGETRTVTDGMVACPRRGGRRVAASTCADCHLLTWLHDERDLRSQCSTEVVEAMKG